MECAPGVFSPANTHRNSVYDGINIVADPLKKTADNVSHLCCTTLKAIPSFILKYGNIHYTFVSSFRYGANASKKLLGFADDVYLLGPLRMLAGIKIPISVTNIFGLSKEVAEGKGMEKADALLNISAEIGDIGDAVSTFACGLGSTGLVAARSIVWATPLLAASVPFEAIGVLVSVKQWVQTYFFGNNFNKMMGSEKAPEEYTLADYRKGLAAMEKGREEKRYYFRQHFNTNEDKLVDRLIDIDLEVAGKLNSQNPEEIKAGQEMLHKTAKTLKGRVSTVNWSRLWGAVAGTVQIIGISILIASPAFIPIPVGFTFLTVGAVLSIAKFVFDRYMNARFEKAIGYN